MSLSDHTRWNTTQEQRHAIAAAQDWLRRAMATAAEPTGTQYGRTVDDALSLAAQAIAAARDAAEPTNPETIKTVADLIEPESAPHDLKSALETHYGHGFADDQAGDVNEAPAHVYRVDRWLVWTDSQGFSDVDEYGTDGAAAEQLESFAGTIAGDDEEPEPAEPEELSPEQVAQARALNDQMRAGDDPGTFAGTINMATGAFTPAEPEEEPPYRVNPYVNPADQA